MIKLRPLVEPQDQIEEIERELLAAVRRAVFLPLLREIDPQDAARVLENSIDDVVLAVAKGEIQYLNGHFEGRFRGAVSRELKKMGATFDRRRKWWTIPYSEVDIEVRSAIAISHTKFKQMAESAERALARVVPEEVGRAIDFNKLFDSVVFKMEQQFKKNVSKIGVVPKLSPATKEYIRARYLENPDLAIRSKKADGIASWVQTEVDSLRAKVNKNTFEFGVRRESLVKDIERQYQVTARKAKFLARQETSLIVASYQEKRYQDVGVKRYIWKCVNNPPAPAGSPPRPHEVRPDHWALNDSIQRWDAPPIVDEATGRRRHPKQDFNCRCTAIPIVE